MIFLVTTNHVPLAMTTASSNDWLWVYAAGCVVISSFIRTRSADRLNLLFLFVSCRILLPFSSSRQHRQLHLSIICSELQA